MRAVYWKELVELLLAALAGTAFAVVFGSVLGHETHREIAVSFIGTLGFGGWLVGAWQGVYDRTAAGDEFLRHRPVSAARIHAARGAAGLTVVAVVVGATLASMGYFARRQGLDDHGIPIQGWDLQPWWLDVTALRVAFGALFAASTWALARLGASARHPLVALFTIPGLPLLFVLAIGRTPGALVPTLVAAAALGAAVALGVADAAQRSATRRR